MLLTFDVEKQIIMRTDTEKVVTNSMNYLYARFTFSEEWTGEKTAVFSAQKKTYNALLDENNTCLVPWEALTGSIFTVSVFCGDLITANKVIIYTIPSGYEVGDESRIPTPEIYTQVIEKLNEIEQEIDPEAIQQIVDTYLADKDFVTEDDVETIVSQYVAEHVHGIPTGGTTGQVLVKSSSTDYDTEWADAGSGSGDMTKSTYDPNGVVEDAGGIEGYVEEELRLANVLYGKKWCACGDSFTAGDFYGYVDPEGHTGTESDAYDSEMGMYKTYPWWIAKRNNMNLVMRAQNGNDFTNISGATRPFSNSSSPLNYTQIPSDADYVTIWFGLNEYNLTTEQIGTKADTTNATLWGAYNVVFSSILNNNPLAKIGVFISDGDVANQRIPQEYHDALIEICKYWAIPYLDLRNGLNVPMGLGGRLDECSSTSRLKRKEAFQVTASNTHPNLKAHEYRSTFIENFLRSL